MLRLRAAQAPSEPTLPLRLLVPRNRASNLVQSYLADHADAEGSPPQRVLGSRGPTARPECWHGFGVTSEHRALSFHSRFGPRFASDPFVHAHFYNPTWLPPTGSQATCFARTGPRPRGLSGCDPFRFGGRGRRKPPASLPIVDLRSIPK